MFRDSFAKHAGQCDGRADLFLALLVESLLILLLKPPSVTHAFLQIVRQYLKGHRQITVYWPVFEQARVISLGIVFLRINLLFTYKRFLGLFTTIPSGAPK